MSLPLGKLGGEVALYQLRRSRHFFSEHPKGSDMYRMKEWQAVGTHPKVVKCIFPQCAVGFRGRKTGLPIQEHIEVWPAVSHW